MNNFALSSLILIYLCILFYIAFIVEKRGKSKWVNNPYVYTLSLAVYCSAWTYYGSIGVAANSGISFLPIYLGPVIAAPLWIVILRKVIRISKQHKISSIADFISLRYGNDRFLGALVAFVCTIGTVPYISLQLKAISETYDILSSGSTFVPGGTLGDSTLYIAILLAVFATFFGTQTTDASAKHKGIVATIAIESILKLVFFVVVGCYITFYLFDGTEDLYLRVTQIHDITPLVGFGKVEDVFSWFYMIALSFTAIFLLPRMFQVSVVENVREKHLKQAIWLFPLYLLLFNFFVIFIAWAGKVTFGDSANAEYFTLLLPLNNDNIFIALLVFFGGLSAVISMVVVSTLALSTMVSNNLVIPYGFLEVFSKGKPEKNALYIIRIRRIAVFSIIIIAYIFYASFSIELSLYSIGLISFVVISQLAPSFFIGLFWNRGASKAAKIGIITGFMITMYTLILPFSIQAFTGSTVFISEGAFGISLLKPHALFGVDFLSPPAHAFFWSMLANTLCYLVFSLVSKGNYRERNYAEMFVDSKNFNSLQDSALVWKGEAFVSDIKNVLVRFLGEERTERALRLFFSKYDLPSDTQMADARLINFSEKLLTGSIGNASAKILISGVVKEEEISLIEVLKILEESKETISRNKLLKDKSKQLTQLTEQLKEANVELIEKDQQKDEFLDTVAHEIKTPITGIRAAAELLIEDLHEMPPELSSQFLTNILSDADRMSRLINNLLDFEKLSNGREQLNLEKNSLKRTIETALLGVSQIASNKKITLLHTNKSDYNFFYDEDRILQVMTNLLSNAIKFCEPESGIISIDYKHDDGFIFVEVKDNGKGIPQEDLVFVFDKFYQSKNQNTIKPEGSGLGLAISKQIILQHNGKIWAKNALKAGVIVGFKLPFD